MPKVEFCCCGCALRDGTLILLFLDLVLASIFLLFNLGNFTGFLIWFVMAAIPATGLYGVFKEKPEFLWGHMIYQIITLVIFVVCMAIMLFGGAALIIGIAKSTHHNTYPAPNIDVSSLSFDIIFIIELILAAFAGLQYYFFLVVYSLYTKLRQEASFGIGNRA